MPARIARRLSESDLWYSFTRTPTAMLSAAIAGVMIFSALFAELVAPHNPFDLATVDLFDALLPPVWAEGGDPRYLLGTDDQGRDVFSTILYGARISIVVGVLSVALALVIGVTLGLIAGYVGGLVDSVLMRIADVQLSFPAILIALLIDGVARGLMPRESHGALAR